MNDSAGPEPPAPHTPPTSALHLTAPRWGLSEVAVGVVLSQTASFVVSVLVFAAAGWTSIAEVPLWAGAVLQVPLWAGWTVAVVLAGRKGGGWVRDFGFRLRPIDVSVGLGLGVAMQLVVLPLVYVPVLRILDRSPEELSAPARELTDKAQGPAGWAVLTLIVVVGAPVFEELFYRGLLLGALRKRGHPTAVSVLASSALFAAMHLQSLQFLGLFLLGAVLSLLVVRTGRLGPAIMAHAGFNATTVLVLYLSS